MQLVESHFIEYSKSKLWLECDSLCFRSKNLYNYSLYLIRKQYEESKTYLGYHELNRRFSQENQTDYRALHVHSSQQTMMLLDKNFKSFFQALKAYQKTPSKFKGCPQIPGFKHKKKGRSVVVFTKAGVSRVHLKKRGVLKLSQCSLEIKTKLSYDQINQVRIVPLSNNNYKIEIIYTRQEKPLVEDNGNYAGIDLGLNNLFTVAYNRNPENNKLVSGRPLKSINQFYNKKLAHCKSKLEIVNKKKSSRRINKLTTKKNNKISDYLHKASKQVVQDLKQNNVSKVVVGLNKTWKTEINIGKRNNQNFVSIPHSRFIEIFKYKLELEGITLIVREESYTSKCSALDLEPVKKHEKYKGRRVKRGLFKSQKGVLYNADINGAANILRKEIPRSFDDGIEGLVLNPKLIKIL